MISLHSPVNTLWHDLPVGLKLGFLCIATIGLFYLRSPVSLLLCCALVALMYALGGILFFTTGLKRLFFLWPFLLVIALWHAITSTYATGFEVALRLLAAVALANLVTMSTKLTAMVDTVSWLLSPLARFGVSTKPLELAIAMVVRFTPMLFEKSVALRYSWQARSSSRAGWRIVFPLFVLAIDDAEQVAESLRARGGAATGTKKKGAERRSKSIK